MLDESLPRKLKYCFEKNHEVWTVRDKGWLSKKNGVLLKRMTDDGFELFVTVDRNLQYQQNIKNLPFKIAVLGASNNRLLTLKELIPVMFKSMEEANLSDVIEIFAI